MEETLVNFGSEIKVLSETDDAWRVGGWAVVFGTKDVSNLKDEFSSATDYDFVNGEARSIYYNHGLDSTIKKTRIGRASLEMKDAGIWYEGQVSKRTDYLKRHAEKIVDGIKAGIFGTSTGAPAHLVEREKIEGGHSVKMWPISEISITPCPAEPLTSCLSLKSLQEIEAADGVESFEDEFKAAKQGDWITINGAHVRVGSAQHRAIVGGSGKPSDTEVLAALDQHGVTDNKARIAVLDAHDKGHITSHDQLRDVAKQTKKGGGGEGHAVSAINRHGEHGDYRTSDDERGERGGSDGQPPEAPESLHTSGSEPPEPPDSLRGDAARQPASSDDVDKEADKSGLSDADKKKLKKKHANGKILTREDLTNAISALKDAAKETHERFQQGRQLGEATGGKSLDELLEESEAEFKTVHKNGDWITLNGAHVQVGGDLHKKIFGGKDGGDKAGGHEKLTAHLDKFNAAREKMSSLEKEASSNNSRLKELSAQKPVAKHIEDRRKKIDSALAKASDEFDKYKLTGATPEQVEAKRKSLLASHKDYVAQLKESSPDAVKEHDALSSRNNDLGFSPGQDGFGRNTDSLVASGGISSKARSDLRAAANNLYDTTLNGSQSMGEAKRKDIFNEIDGDHEDLAAAANKVIEHLRAQKKSRKSDDDETDFPDTPETKHLTALESGLLDGLDFTSHSAKVLAAVEEFVERSDGLKTRRCEGEGRRWSAEKYSQLNELAHGLTACADEIKAIADAHAPRSVTNAEFESSLDAEIDELEISFMQQQMRLNDLLPRGLSHTE